MNCPCYERLISAGSIPPGDDVYTVVLAPEHKTLKPGDRVLMRESANYENTFVRVDDLTLHGLQSDVYGYVVVAKTD